EDERRPLSGAPEERRHRVEEVEARVLGSRRGGQRGEVSEALAELRDERHEVGSARADGGAQLLRGDALEKRPDHLDPRPVGRRARGGTGQRLMSGILSTRLFELPTPLLVLPGVSSAQVSWRPNIFGGQDCIGPEGRSSSTPNVFGGYDTTFPDGSRSSSHPNVFGDEDTTTPKGTIESRPNIFGGKEYRLANSWQLQCSPTIFGGQDFRQRIPRRGV